MPNLESGMPIHSSGLQLKMETKKRRQHKNVSADLLVILHLERVQNGRELRIELNVNDGTDNLCNASNDSCSLSLGSRSGSLSRLGSLSLVECGDMEAATTYGKGPAYDMHKVKATVREKGNVTA
jgi:hypothetical protein